MPRSGLITEKAPRPRGPYSHAVAKAQIVATAGQMGVRPGEEWTPVSEDVGEQTRQALKNIEHILAEAGASLDDVVKVGVFLTGADDFPAMNAVYKEFFSEPYPARTTVYVGLPVNIKVEIDTLAVID